MMITLAGKTRSAAKNDFQNPPMEISKYDTESVLRQAINQTPYRALNTYEAIRDIVAMQRFERRNALVRHNRYWIKS